ncbi:EF-hand calcium-binding domain-containing protein 2 [Ditylenchus destructor]|uniref:EF-hand calcium-binding domain-containing protein 2 n=1 Tax=Ditylenchus destructor TaxID=166010 RepID=A0AAD4RAN2_9BILA|nr:EF-hand calcium-binding domain-containing protein 2 [Ditylenchus destructor]
MSSSPIEKSGDDGAGSSAESDTSSIYGKEDDIRRHMEDIFRAFDQRGDQSIDLSDLGHVFRCMKVNLTQAELYEIEAQLVKEPNHSVKFEYLIPRLMVAVQEKKWKPKDETTIEFAFRSLEMGEQLTRDRLENYIRSRGEPFSEAEFKEMLSHLAIRRSGIVDWKSYVKDITESLL